MQVYFQLQLLMAAAGLGFLQLMLAAGAARRGQSGKWALGPRDEAAPVGVVAARLDRAFRNFMETFPFFAVAVLVAYLGGRISHPLVGWGEMLYLGARIAYVPLYAAGVPVLRTLVWFVSIVGIGLVTWAVFT